MGSEDLTFLPHADLKPTYTSFTYKINDTVLEISLNRPKTLNSMNMAFFIDIYHIFRAVNYSPKDIRCVIIYSTGKHFSAGLDCWIKSKRNRNGTLR